MGVERIAAFIMGKKPHQVRSFCFIGTTKMKRPIRGSGDAKLTFTQVHRFVLPKHKRWMLDVVSNGRNGIDVDRLDYLDRDAHHTLGGGTLFWTQNNAPVEN